DVIALLFAMASPKELKIQALTTVAGNVPLEKTARNARLAREWGKRPDIPVYAGAPRPLLRTPIWANNAMGVIRRYTEARRRITASGYAP
ncbi:nucleoside hydrolase, partial [Escherichia coli]|uniref:nucleoside hydrolase n=1 Tax=Escherichia coli TaxID=562 RepID=UPI00390C93CB